MKRLIWILFFPLIVLFLAFCKKLEPNEPIIKDGIKLFNFITNDDMPYSPRVNWLLKPDGEVWTWAKNGDYKIFDVNQTVSGFNIPYSTISPGKNTLPKYFSSFTYSTDFHTNNIYHLNSNGNIEHAYLDTINDETGMNSTKLYLCKNEINKSGIIINQDSVFLQDVFLTLDLRSFKFTKSATNYYFAFELNQTSNTTFVYTDTLYLLKTDLNLNIQKTYKKPRDYNANTNYSNPEVFDIKTNGTIVCLIYRSVNNDNYNSARAMEVLDIDLNLIKRVRADECINIPATGYDEVFKKIIIQNNKIYLFGTLDPEYYSSSSLIKMYVTIFDLNGNLIEAKTIPTKQSYPYFRGVEPTSDGKFIVYFNESGGGTFDKVGVCKLDQMGNAEYSLMFPESDDSSYDPLFVYEGLDGIINIYGSRYFNNFNGEQTFFVKLNREGKIQ
jgi:hypothetical protein